MSVILLSGGLDSMAAAARDSRHGTGHACLFIRYGQEHEVPERRAARQVAAALGLDWHEARIALPAIDAGLLTGTAQPARALGLPLTFMPGRNAIFLSLAAGVAASRDDPTLVIGCNAHDAAGYPDCRPEYLAAAERALRLALDWPALSISAPCLHLEKQDVARLARDAGHAALIPVTLSCYHGTRCGACDACRQRADAGIAP